VKQPKKQTKEIDEIRFLSRNKKRSRETRGAESEGCEEGHPGHRQN
jgi:hypothetical protein